MAKHQGGAPRQNRDRSNGRYSYDGNMDRVCARCGQTLGIHTAEAPHDIDDGFIGRYCKGFRPAKVQPSAEAIEALRAAQDAYRADKQRG